MKHVSSNMRVRCYALGVAADRESLCPPHIKAPPGSVGWGVFQSFCLKETRSVNTVGEQFCDGQNVYWISLMFVIILHIFWSRPTPRWICPR